LHCTNRIQTQIDGIGRAFIPDFSTSDHYRLFNLDHHAGEEEEEEEEEEEGLYLREV